jgi:ABC-2 type transport system permease protein
MSGTIFRISFLNLKRDRVALLLTFVLPVAFFSIFAGVFGNRGGGTSRVKLAIVDEDQSEPSRRLIADLSKDPGLRVTTSRVDGSALDRASVEALVKEGNVPVAIVVPKGFGETFGAFGGEGKPVDLLADKADPVAPQLVFGLLQKAAMTSAPDLLAERGLAIFEKYGGAFTPQQKDAVGRFLPRLRAGTTDGSGAPSTGERLTEPPGEEKGPGGSNQFTGLVRVNTIDVLGEKKSSGLIAFYAAGTGVMFLLFSMSGASGTLLDDEESGTLERLLTSNVGMGGLLLGKWLFIALMGVAQVTVMFLWGALVFKIDLAKHLGGFTVMTITTAAAAAAFGLVLATASRTRQQLAGISTILILVMSAMGGSMFPRFLMSDFMQRVGLLTFNAWALDGYQKVFWYELPLSSLWPQVSMLAALTVAFLAIARFLARRWETV